MKPWALHLQLMKLLLTVCSGLLCALQCAFCQSIEIGFSFPESLESQKALFIEVSENGKSPKKLGISGKQFKLSVQRLITYEVTIKSDDTLVLSRFNIDPRSVPDSSFTKKQSFPLNLTEKDLDTDIAPTWVYNIDEAAFEKFAVESRKQKKAQLEAEMRAAEAAAEEEAKRRAEIERLEIERRQREADARRAEEERLAAIAKAEEDKRKREEARKAAEERKKLEASEAAFEAERKRKAKEAYEAEQRAKVRAQAVMEAQKRERDEAIAIMETERKSLAVKDAGAVVSRTVEEIEEVNRKITRITINRERMNYVYQKVAYNWGGIYYFRDDDSITKAVFELETKKE